MHKSNATRSYDVIIAGAGPVGLFLACELALAKCSVLVLEKAVTPDSVLKQLPFGLRGLNAPTVEAFYRRGLLDAMEVPKRLKDPFIQAKGSAGAPAPRQVGHFAGIGFFEAHIDATQWKHRLPESPPAHLLAEMQEIETILARRAEALGATIERGAGVTDFRASDNGVAVRSGEHVFDGLWLVGCDGSRSAVRKAAGVDFAGTEPEFTGYSTKMEIADPEKLQPGRTLTTTGLYWQSQPGYLVMQEFDGGACHSAEPVTREHVQAVLRRISGTDVTVRTVHTATTWTDRARQATSYRQGRVLLAGDAAHIHAPLGGQGLNLGIGDAMNLGWKLAATLRRGAPESLVDTYHSERHPIGARVLDWSRAQVAVMRPGAPARALNAILRDVIGTRDGATYFAGRVWGVNTRYDLGGDHPLAGHSVPNFEFEDGTLLGTLLHDGAWTLLDFEGRAPLEALAHACGSHVRYVTGRPREALGLRAALVRPDGYIALAAADTLDAEAVKALCR